MRDNGVREERGIDDGQERGERIHYLRREGYADVDNATVLGVCDSLREAKRDAKDLGYNAVSYSYRAEGGKLVDQQYE